MFEARVFEVLQISAGDVVPLSELDARIAAAAGLGAGGRFALQLRDPELDGRSLVALAERLRARMAGMTLLVNDRVDVAVAVGADGVHLGRRSMAPRDARRLLGDHALVTVSCHDPAELREAPLDGVDAVVLAPIFASPGKGAALGLRALSQARELLPPAIALVALGGVDLERAPGCRAAGADAVAAIRADLTPLLGKVG
jgi:thiamine-phosphate pyrophosphorylase